MTVINSNFNTTKTQAAFASSVTSNAMLTDGGFFNCAIQSTGSYTNAFVTNPTASTFYPVHNGAATPQYCAQTLTLTKRSLVVFYGGIGIYPTFTGNMCYVRFNVRQTNQVTGTSLFTTGVNGVRTLSGATWWQLPVNGAVVLDPGQYGIWAEYCTDSNSTGSVYGCLWNMTTLVFPAQ